MSKNKVRQEAKRAIAKHGKALKKLAKLESQPNSHNKEEVT